MNRERVLMKTKRKHRSDNLLDYIPVREEHIRWDEDSDHMVVLHRQNKGACALLCRVLFHRPKLSHITLERYGSYVWRNIDGQRSLYELALGLRGEFEAEAEPLFERFVPYIKSLHVAGCIYFL